MTAVVPERTEPVGAPSLPLLPESPRRAGPVTRRLLARTALALLAIESLAAVLIASGGPTAEVVGSSLIVPGGGLLHTGRPLLVALTAALVVLGIVLWWAMSLIWGIPLVWALSGLAAVVLDDGTRWDWAVPVAAAVAAGIVGSAAWSWERRYRTKRAKVAELNEYLRTATVPEPSRPVREPDAMDAELLRWCHELALQPLDDFRGFEWGEQLHGGTCVRYQLNYLGWALATYAVNFVPNAPQPMEEVLRNLVLKQTDLRVWGYWRGLNLVGNLDGHPDPLRKDNIMFSGFTGDQINMYVAATGDRRFDEPGSLTFVWKDGREFAYDHRSWMEAVQRNFADSRLGFFPCEPGWAFAACNTIGAQALLGYDSTHGTSMWAEVEERWRRTLLDEYLLPDGNYANIRCTRTGLSWDTGETPGGEYLTTGTNQFTDVAPDLAARGQALAVRGLPEKLAPLSAMVDDHGELALELPLEWERNRARRTALNGWTKLIAGARMIGDERLAAAAQRAADRQCATGDRWPERPVAAGVQNLATHAIVRWSTPLTTGDLNVRGHVPPAGPLLASAPWPSVLVTLARSDDGRSLDLALQRHELPAGAPVRLGFARLEPGARYRLAGTGSGHDAVELVAVADGTAEVDLVLAEDGPTRRRLEPIGGAA
ncbi:MAG: hypothetical protein ACLGIC_10260 [Acidimicrobiia bacterium]